MKEQKKNNKIADLNRKIDRLESELIALHATVEDSTKDVDVRALAHIKIKKLENEVMKLARQLLELKG